MASGPRIASSSNTSATRSATAIGNARIASRPVLAPRSRNAFPSFSPAIASAIDGDLASGGVIALMYARKLATARTFLSNAGYAAASCACRGFSPSAVVAASPQNVTAEPSGCGANTRTSGSINSRPNAGSLRSLITERRRRPTVCAIPGAVNPGAISLFRRMPPTTSLRSSSVTSLPAFARYAAATRPLWPPPMTITRSVAITPPASRRASSPSGTRARRCGRARP